MLLLLTTLQVRRRLPRIRAHCVPVLLPSDRCMPRPPVCGALRLPKLAVLQPSAPLRPKLRKSPLNLLLALFLTLQRRPALARSALLFARGQSISAAGNIACTGPGPGHIRAEQLLQYPDHIQTLELLAQRGNILGSLRLPCSAASRLGAADAGCLYRRVTDNDCALSKWLASWRQATCLGILRALHQVGQKSLQVALEQRALEQVVHAGAR